MEASDYQNLLIEQLRTAFGLTGDLVQGLPDNAFKLKLDKLPSNTIGQQLWCMVGARESYLKAIENGAWSGFGSSLDDTTSKTKILHCLQESLDDCLSYLIGHILSEVQAQYLIALLQHEIQHHGQLIRYVYGNRLPFPGSWNEQYTV